MRGYVAFLKKEYLESIRTHKLLLLLAIFILFGIMSPMLAKLTPDLIKSMLNDSAIEALSIPEPTAIDAYAQFFKNTTQMGFIVLLLIFGGTLNNEINKGTLLLLLTKGLSRTSVLLSKFTMASILWTIAYGLCFLITFTYANLLFPAMEISHLWLSVSCVWLFGMMLLAILILASTLSSSTFAPLLLTGSFLAICFLLMIVPALQDYNPLKLVSDNKTMLSATYAIGNMAPSICVCLMIMLGSILLSNRIFRKKVI